jgi:hypothetical protein
LLKSLADQIEKKRVMGENPGPRDRGNKRKIEKRKK